jgi:DUF4097 and DUF4098 domain-containing protein YvlB
MAVTAVSAAAFAAALATDAAAKSDELKRKGSHYVQIIDRTFDVKPGGELHIEAPNGPIQVKTWNKNEVHVYVERKLRTRDEDDAREMMEDFPTTVEKKGNDVWIETEKGGWRHDNDIEGSYRVTVPREFNLDLTTAGGSIEIDDLDGDVEARTAGGSIEVGDVTGEVDVKTAGGSIEISSGGQITLAKTAGGSIEIGDADGDVVAETAGGSITVDRAKGSVEVETAGGGIKLGPSGGDVDASTAGGSIRIDETKGRVKASTAGGSIKVDGSGGPVRVSTSGGSISVSDARGGVHASTSGGGVTVELNVAKGVDATSDLETAGGDVTIYIPADLAVTIDAKINRTKDKYWIHSDFPMEIDYTGGRAKGRLDLNGGGDKIRLRTSQGDINIRKLK